MGREALTGEELLENPQQGVVVLGAEDLRDKRPTFYEEVGRQTHGLEHQLGLGVGILHPSSSDIGCAIVQDGIGFPQLQVLPYRSPALIGRNIALEGYDLGYRLDRSKIYAYDEAVDRAGLGGDLTPALDSQVRYSAR